MSNFLKILFFAISSFILISCDKKFNSKEWKNTSFEDHLDKNNNRNLMINDLISSKLLIEKNPKEIKNILGKPDFKDSTKGTFQYETLEDFGWNIDPQYYRGIEIYFGKDSLVKEVKIYEIKTK